VTTDLVLYEREGAVLTITLNRPERLNAMTAGFLEVALSALEAAAADDAVRVVVLAEPQRRRAAVLPGAAGIRGGRHAYCCATQDAREAAEAFVDKRVPAFRGH
jgi:1,4-dihydroxy-2-naphthoyl-CoA synthase